MYDTIGMRVAAKFYVTNAAKGRKQVKPKRVRVNEQRIIDKLMSSELDYYVEEEHIREVPKIVEGLGFEE